MLKSIKGKKNNAKFKDKCSKLKSHADKTLFNISSCKCRSFLVCSCARDRKIPEREQIFLRDQRISRKMEVGGVDAAVSKKIVILQERKSRFELFQIKQQKSQNNELLDPETYMISTSESSTDHESDTAADPDYLATPSSQMKRKLNFKNPPAKRMNLAGFASACNRTGVSDRAAAIIASSVLHDNAGCSETNPSLVLDRSKVRRSLQKHRRFFEERSKEADNNKYIIALYFDGRKDQAMTKKVSGNSKEILQEEHISLVEEPGSE